MLIKILLAGEGGQGIQTIADVISKAAFEKGLNISSIPNYGLEQRGGVSLSYIKISDEEIAYPRFTRPDILLIMSDEARERTKKYVVAQGFSPDGTAEAVRILDIRDYKNILQEKNVPVYAYNIFFLGVLAKILEERGILTNIEISKFLEEKLSKKQGWEENKKAFETGLNQ